MKMGHTVGVAREQRSLNRRCLEPAQEADRGCVSEEEECRHSRLGMSTSRKLVSSSTPRLGHD
jgi:hypothetical protein